MIYIYDESFEGFLTCVFESFKNKEMPQDIASEREVQISLLPTFNIETDSAKADRVFKSLIKNFGYEILFFIQNAFLSCLKHKEIILLEFFHKIYKDKKIIKDISDNTVLTLTKAVENLTGEAHLFKGFVRFDTYKDIFIAFIKPKNFVLHILVRHFIERLPNENFIIYDETHKTAAIYRKDGFLSEENEVISLEECDKEELAAQSNHTPAKLPSPILPPLYKKGIYDTPPVLPSNYEKNIASFSIGNEKGAYRIIEIDFDIGIKDDIKNQETNYRDLWKKFYDTIAIKERTNLKLRQNLMPKRYWSNMFELEMQSYGNPKQSAEKPQKNNRNSK